MRRFLLAPALAFALGLLFGVLLAHGPHPVTDSPWPAPTPILAVVDTAKLDRAQCEAELAELAITCNIAYTGRPNPPRSVKP